MRWVGITLVLLSVGCRSGAFERSDMATGRVLFANYCSACHQVDGSGMEGGGPPLAGSSWVAGPDSRLIRIVLGGVRGVIDVGEQSYDREMLSFGKVLSDEEIASILTFVRDRWGVANTAVSAESVSKIRVATKNRTQYWTVEELLELE